MAITTVPLSSVGQTHYGTAPNNVGAFTGTFAYDNRSATLGVITLTIRNATNPAARGSLVAVAWNTPAGATITNLAIAFNDTSFDLINIAPAAFDCANGVTGYGNATMGVALPSTETTTQPVVTWNCPGVIPRGPRSGLRPQQSGTVIVAIGGSGLGAVSAAAFQAALSSGANATWFPGSFSLAQRQ